MTKEKPINSFIPNALCDLSVLMAKSKIEVRNWLSGNFFPKLLWIPALTVMKRIEISPSAHKISFFKSHSCICRCSQIPQFEIAWERRCHWHLRSFRARTQPLELFEPACPLPPALSTRRRRQRRSDNSANALPHFDSFLDLRADGKRRGG